MLKKCLVVLLLVATGSDTFAETPVDEQFLEPLLFSLGYDVACMESLNGAQLHITELNAPSSGMSVTITNENPRVHVLAVPPGRYGVSHITVSNPEFEFITDAVLITESMEFDVLPQSVNYLGELRLQSSDDECSDNELIITATDQYDRDIKIALE